MERRLCEINIIYETKDVLSEDLGKIFLYILTFLLKSNWLVDDDLTLIIEV